MDMVDKALNLVKSIDINNTWQALILAIVVMVVVVRYISSFLTSNIELLFMKKKEEHKKELATFFFLFIIFTIANCFYVSDSSYVAVEIVVLAVAFIFYIIKEIIRWIKKKLCKKKEDENKKQDLDFQIFIIGICFSIVIYFLSFLSKINVYSLAVIVSVAETVVIQLFYDASGTKKSKIVINIEKNGEVLYVYKKVSEDYLLCGNDSDMKQASKIVAVKVEKLYSGECYLVLDKKVK